MYNMEIFNSFLHGLNAYTQSEIDEIEEHYAVAITTRDRIQIVNAFLSSLSVCFRYNHTELPMSLVSLILSFQKDLAILNLPRKAVERGALVFRSLFVREIADLRVKLSKNMPEHAKEFLSRGYVSIENFLSRERLDSIRNDISRFPIGTSKETATIISKISPRENLHLHDFLWNTRLREYVFDCMFLPDDHPDASDQFRDNTFVQRVHNIPGDKDTQKIMHMDTYFDATKFWYFPKEVRLENGPVSFSPYSNQISIERLNWMQDSYMKFYNKEIEPERGYGHAQGSLRAFSQEIDDMNLNIKFIEVPENTLVIANVFGFHGRGEATIESIRESIHGSIRLRAPW